MTEAKKRNEGTMTLRVDRDLLKAFQNIAKDNNRTARGYPRIRRK